MFHFENETGEGTITAYDIFPGVIVAYNDFHMNYYDSAFIPDQDVFCIDYCREGRLEYWMHTHGIASMITTDFCDWNLEKAERMVGNVKLLLQRNSRCKMFTNKDLKNLILPLFVEQFLLMFVGIADTFVVSFCLSQS